MTRIAYVNADCGIPVFGNKGGSVHVREMIRAFEAIGCGVRCLATRLGEPGGDPLAERTIAVEMSPRPVSQERSAKERHYLEAAGALSERLIRLHEEWPFDLIYERYSLWSAAAVRASFRLGVPAVVEVNAPLLQEQETHRELALRASAEAIEHEVFAGARGLAVVSDGVRRYVVSRGGSEERIETIGNGVDIVRFHPGAAPERVAPPGAFAVGFTGSLKQWHGIDVLLEAFRLLHRGMPEAHLVIVGDGPMRGWIDGWLAGAGLTHAATLTGWRDHEDLPGLLAGMDVVTAPYPATEDFYFSPLKLYEYLAMGRPIAASRIGQIAETISDGADGLLVEPGDPAALATAMRRIGCDPRLAETLAHGAAKTGQRYSWSSNARRVLEMAQRIRRAA